MKDLAHTTELKQEQNQRYILYGGILVLFFLGLFIYRNYRLKKRDHQIIAAQKAEVEIQKELVEEKNKEIIDSINYAKRLQDAIMPSEKKWKSVLANSFILYLPKDIVAGDFYFLEQDENHLIIAAADSTGHGVPGALVSVVCANALTRSIKEFKLNDAGLILDKTRNLVMETFSTGGKNVKDGMDISLVSLAIQNEKQSQEPNKNSNSFSTPAFTLRWAGANNPLWILRKGAGEIEEIRANKQPIGHTENPQPFTTHKMTLGLGDMIYLFTDGYADQFGGPKGKKFKYSSLKELLIQIAQLPLSIQQNRLETIFKEWRNDLEQVDDVCIIGVRF